MVTPALPAIADDFNIPEGFMRQLVMTIFLLGYAQGPFVLAPLSEIFGRVTVLQYANLVYLVFNTACGFARTQNQMLTFRFLSGLGGAAPQAVSLLHLSGQAFIRQEQQLTCLSCAMGFSPTRGVKKSAAKVKQSMGC
jgi:MFS family permease